MSRSEGIDDFELDEALGITPSEATREPAIRNSNMNETSIRAKQDRLAALRERVQMRKIAREQGMGASNNSDVSASNLSKDQTTKDETNEAAETRQSTRRQTNFEEDPSSLTMSIVSSSKRTSFASTKAEDSVEAKKPVGRASSYSAGSAHVVPSRRSRKSEELREKLRQKEAQLAALRNRTFSSARKRPSTELSTSLDRSSTMLQQMQAEATQISANSMTLVASQENEDERAQKHQDNIKRLKMMAAKKREDLARYRSRFAVTSGLEKATTSTTTAY